jgi:hypothetical protein
MTYRRNLLVVRWKKALDEAFRTANSGNIGAIIVDPPATKWDRTYHRGLP